MWYDKTSAIGVCAAIIVALIFGIIPLWKEHGEKEKKRYILQVQLLSILSPLLVRINSYLLRGSKSYRYKVISGDVKLYEDIKLLFPQMVVLKSYTLKAIYNFMFQLSLIMHVMMKELDYDMINELKSKLTEIIKILNKEINKMKRGRTIKEKDNQRWIMIDSQEYVRLQHRELRHNIE